MLIGLHGEAGSGKDQSFAYIEEFAASRGRSVRRSAFGDKLKISAVRALGFDGSDAECLAQANRMKAPGWEVIVVEPDGTQHPLTSREYWQCFGDEAHRMTFDIDFWLPFVTWEFERMDWDYLVVTDVRYPNEARAVREAGGEIWHIVRPDQESLPGDHTSEQGLPPELIDCTITNDKGLKTLRRRMRLALKDNDHGTDH